MDCRDMFRWGRGDEHKVPHTLKNIINGEVVEITRRQNLSRTTLKFVAELLDDSDDKCRLVGMIYHQVELHTNEVDYRSH
jgi:hypothetical protein